MSFRRTKSRSRAQFVQAVIDGHNLQEQKGVPCEKRNREKAEARSAGTQGRHREATCNPTGRDSRLLKIDDVMGQLFPINEARSDLAWIMNDWNPSGVATESHLMPPTALVNLLSEQYEAFAIYLNDALLELRKGGAAGAR